jgi:hypothetical protein
MSMILIATDSSAFVIIALVSLNEHLPAQVVAAPVRPVDDLLLELSPTPPRYLRVEDGIGLVKHCRDEYWSDRAEQRRTDACTEREYAVTRTARQLKLNGKRASADIHSEKVIRRFRTARRHAATMAANA